MKLTLANVKEIKRNSSSPLKKRVCNYVINEWSDYSDKKNIFTDVLYQGCQSGIVGELIYYTDKVMGKITEERFVLMSEAYEQEQRQLKETVENSQSEIDRYDEINDNINNFVSLVVRTGRIKKLTPEIVRLLIEKVIVSEKVKTENGYKRTVTICLTHVGEIELP